MSTVCSSDNQPTSFFVCLSFPSSLRCFFVRVASDLLAALFRTCRLRHLVFTWRHVASTRVSVVFFGGLAAVCSISGVGLLLRCCFLHGWEWKGFFFTPDPCFHLVLLLFLLSSIDDSGFAAVPLVKQGMVLLAPEYTVAPQGSVPNRAALLLVPCFSFVPN